MPQRHLPDEEHLIRRAQKGDLEAFAQLYHAYAPLVLRFFNAHLDNPLDAEDLTEETFLRVWEALPAFTVRSAPFGGYLFRVARNALYDHYRRQRNHLPLASLDSDPAAETVAQDDPRPTAENTDLRRALIRLSPDHRMVLTLRFLLGLSTQETAMAMRRSPAAVRALQHRALLCLRRILTQQEVSDHESPSH